MSQAVRCPHCGKRFAARAEMLGRRVRCSRCNEPFTAEAEEELEFAPDPTPTTLSPPPPPPPASVPRPAVAPARGIVGSFAGRTAAVASSRGRSSGTYDERQTPLFRLGLRLLVLGGLALLLPVFGLQLRMAALLGTTGGVVAAVLLPLGGIFCLLGKTRIGGRLLGRFGTLGGVILAIGFVLLLLFVLFLAIGFFVERARWQMPADNFNAHGPPASWRPPRVVSRQTLEQQYGADRVVHVRVIVDDPSVWKQTKVLDKIMDALIRSPGVTATSGYSGLEGHVDGAPIANLDSLPWKFPVDPSSVKVDNETRTLTVDLTHGAIVRP